RSAERNWRIAENKNDDIGYRLVLPHLLSSQTTKGRHAEHERRNLKVGKRLTLSVQCSQKQVNVDVTVKTE
ncbi:MAG: hypothetical protein WCG22_04860, partial [Lentisphaerota bacterium]